VPFVLRFLDVQLKGISDSLESTGHPALAVNHKPPRPLPPSALEILAMFDRDGPEKTQRYLESLEKISEARACAPPALSSWRKSASRSLPDWPLGGAILVEGPPGTSA